MLILFIYFKDHSNNFKIFQLLFISKITYLLLMFIAKVLRTIILDYIDLLDGLKSSSKIRSDLKTWHDLTSRRKMRYDWSLWKTVITTVTVWLLGNSRRYKIRCVGGVIDNDSELEIKGLNYNSSSLSYVLLTLKYSGETEGSTPSLHSYGFCISKSLSRKLS